ncbi:hypothetical protein JHK82_043498 [Glycine max]|nr:hypothetical protein JHK86_043384 [Glycine max]KAG5106528.1 hypothetical protein JHK82_043498 [Glycine max]
MFQALCEELTRKAATLVAENENLKRIARSINTEVEKTPVEHVPFVVEIKPSSGNGPCFMNLTNNGQQICVCGQQHLKFVWKIKLSINNGQQHLKCLVRRDKRNNGECREDLGKQWPLASLCGLRDFFVGRSNVYAN